MSFGVVEGMVMGQCKDCNQPTMGKFDTETNQKCESDIEMECVNCHKKEKYFYLWPDELPVFKLRKRRLRGPSGGKG